MRHNSLDDDNEIEYNCATCGELNESFVDPSGGKQQTYTEDCRICCRPNVLHISLLPDGTFSVDVEFEG